MTPAGKPGQPTQVDVSLSGATLPDGARVQRRMPRPAARQSAPYVEAFDARTLVYDCFYDSRAGCVVLVCPRLLNLWPMMRRGFSVQGRPVRPRRQVLIRSEVLRLPVEQAPGSVTLQVAGHRFDMPVGPSLVDRFAGRNVLLAVSKDNPLEWIEQWARYHASAHGADAVVLFDNGSARYGTDDIRATLAQVPGLQDVAVISAPYPYGPTAPGGGRWETSSRFFQTSMLNLARLRQLARARAVLSADIDEIVLARDGGSVFDAAARSALGITGIAGSWGYVEGATGPRPQNEHVWTLDKPISANTKWCVAPGRRLGGSPWQVHKVAELLFPLTMDRNFSFIHCRATSTGWKRKKITQPKNLVRDPAIVELFARHLPPQG